MTMECLNIALDAKRAFEAQRERCISLHEELHSLKSGDFAQDSLLVAFYALCETGGDPDLAMVHFTYRMMSLGYDAEEYGSASSTFVYAFQQFISTDGLANLDKFVEREDWRYEG